MQTANTRQVRLVVPAVSSVMKHGQFVRIARERTDHARMRMLLLALGARLPVQCQ